MPDYGSLETIHRDGLARICKFYTPHGVIETPSVMPVINPNLIVIPGKEMRVMGAEAVITNSYIIRRSDNLRKRALSEGVHSLIGFDGPVMTDSGTFQSYMYGDIEFDNQEIVEFQKKIGSDICTILDIFTTPEDSYEKTKAAVEETYRRAREVDMDGTIIAGPIQGSIFPDLRRKSARLMNSLEIGYLPVGGVVPLLESYSYDRLVEIIRIAKLNSRFSKPLHLFGGGHPMFLAMAVMLGIDLFDSASYVKYARDDRMIFPDRTMDLKDLRFVPDWSPLSEKFTARELQDLEREQRIPLLSRHNLFAIFAEIKEIKQRIAEQTLRKYVIQKARSHPYLMDALQKLSSTRGMEKFEDLSRKSPFLLTDRLGLRDPVIPRLRNFCNSIVKSSRMPVVIIGENLVRNPSTVPQWIADLYRNRNALFIKFWNGIPIPLELWNTYPVQQSILPRNIQFSRKSQLKNDRGKVIELKEEVDDIPDLESCSRNLELETLRMVGRYQFSMDSFSDVLPDDSEIRISRRTGRIRTISLQGKLLATLRASDGFLTFTIEGARMLHQASKLPRHRVVVNDESVEFNSAGRNVFFKFITGVDPGIIPGNEVLVVDSRDDLVAVGKAMASGIEMRQMVRGVAVDVRAGTGQA